METAIIAVAIILAIAASAIILCPWPGNENDNGRNQ